MSWKGYEHKFVWAKTYNPMSLLHGANIDCESKMENQDLQPAESWWQ